MDDIIYVAISNSIFQQIALWATKILQSLIAEIIFILEKHLR